MEEWYSRQQKKIENEEAIEILKKAIILNDTISGFTLNDFLIMKNWMMYAKKINDINYEKFDCDINISKYMEWELSRQIDFRRSEYNKNH